MAHADEDAGKSHPQLTSLSDRCSDLFSFKRLASPDRVVQYPIFL